MIVEDIERFAFLAVALMCLSVNVASAQSFEEIKKRQQDAFGAYKSNAEAEFEAYRSRLNAEFAEFMRRSWTKKDSEEPLKNVPTVPDVPPVVLPDLDEVEIPEDNEIDVVDVTPIVIEDEPISITPIKYKPRPKEKTVEFTLYGTPCRVRFDLDGREYMRGSDENAAADFWKALSSGSYDNILADCLETKRSLNLCDWAYYKMLDAVSKAIYGTRNETAMLCAFLMNQSGFKVRLGRSGDGKIHLLVNTAGDICNYSYYTLGGENYYLVEDDGVGSMHIFDNAFPKEKSLRLTIQEENNVAVKASRERVLRSRKYPEVTVAPNANLNLLELYSDYPRAYTDGDSRTMWGIYANAPMSRGVREKIYPKLAESIKGRTQAEAANILINFVQTAFEYKTDDESWGYERAFFPDETLYYPYSDCEDRAILFSRLVRDLMGLKAVLLYYPGHLAAAVEFAERIPGDYIILNGHRYLVCDPTYINADIGMTMPGMDNSKAYVVML